MGCWTYEEPRSQFVDWEDAVLPNDRERWEELKAEIWGDDGRLNEILATKGFTVDDTTGEEDELAAGEAAYLQIMAEDKAALDRERRALESLDVELPEPVLVS
jgi:hypothetical protein